MQSECQKNLGDRTWWASGESDSRDQEAMACAPTRIQQQQTSKCQKPRHQQPLKVETKPNKDNTKWHASVGRSRKLMRPQPHTKKFRHLRSAESRGNAFPREEHTRWLSNTKWSTLKTDM